MSTDLLFLSSGIGKHFRFGSQEDAHEFLRYTVDAMQKSCLPGNKWVHTMQFCWPVLKGMKQTFLIHQFINCNDCITLSSSILHYFPFVRLDRQTQATTFVHQIFGGYLRSRGRSSDSRLLWVGFISLILSFLNYTCYDNCLQKGIFKFRICGRMEYWICVPAFSICCYSC